MIKISKQNNSLIVEGIDNVFYPNNGDNSYPLNSLIVVTDNSDMATFRSVATNDVLFSGLIKDITINGEAVTKDNIIEKFDAVSNEGTVDAYTKEEADTKFATKTELTNVQTVANDADTKVDALTTRVESVETAMGNKQDTLVSGTNIKTVNSQSILGEGNIEITGGVSEEQAQEIAKIPTLETEIAQKANVSDVPTVQTGDVGTNKNYIYSDVRSPYAGVISKVYPVSSADKINLRLYLWTPDTSKASYSTEFLSKATTTSAGVMSAADKTKLDSIPENIPTQTEVDNIAANVSTLETSLGNKQDTLVSGTNIKTINSQSILGSGDLTISGVSEEQAQEIAKIPTLETELAQKANVSDIPTVQTDYDGTNKNYIYSSYSDRNCSVYSKFYFRSYANSMDMEGQLWGKDQSWIQNFQIPLVTTSKAGVMSAADKTKLDSISTEWTGTQSEYDALTTKDNNTIYYVTE